MSLITPVLLCGGAGTRLWPLSRKSYPKQFSPLVGEESLFQASARRLSGPEFAAPVVLSHSDFRFIVTEQLAAAGVDPGLVMLEPQARNTGPAVLAAALWLAAQDPDALMLVAPSDHLIPDPSGLNAALEAARPAAEAGQLVSFGIVPDRAETGYGYIELDIPVPEGPPQALRHRCFVEKPGPEAAAQMLASGRFLWNAGIFLFRAQAIVTAFETHAPALLGPVRAALAASWPDLGFLRLAPDPWARAGDISIDYAVMEKAANLSVVPLEGGWSDLGGWDAVWRTGARDARGVACTGAATAIDCDNTLLRSESGGLELVGLGLENIIAVAMPDAVLVADMTRAQDVSRAVRALTARHAPQATDFPKVHRPWGWWETLVLSDRFQVKRITVHPGAALSLQSHLHRAEHWVVVAGTARITLDDTQRLMSENQSIYIPLGATHRLENPGKVPMVLIEVQTGAYLGEDDIFRYDDDYDRVTAAIG